MKAAYRVKSHAYADCMTCGADALSDGVDDSPEPMRSWAVTHAGANPGHKVSHQVHSNSVYERGSVSSDE